MTREKQTFFRQFFNFHQSRNGNVIPWQLDKHEIFQMPFKFFGVDEKDGKVPKQSFCACNTPVSRYRAIGEKWGVELWVENFQLMSFFFSDLQMCSWWVSEMANRVDRIENQNQHRSDCKMPNLDLENDEHARDGERRKPEMAKTSFHLRASPRTCFNMLAETCPSIWLFASARFFLFSFDFAFTEEPRLDTWVELADAKAKKSDVRSSCNSKVACWFAWSDERTWKKRASTEAGVPRNKRSFDGEKQAKPGCLAQN